MINLVQINQHKSILISTTFEVLQKLNVGPKCFIMYNIDISKLSCNYILFADDTGDRCSNYR